MSFNKVNNENEADDIEKSLKEFIDDIVKYFEIYKVEEVNLKNYEKKLNNSENLTEIFEIIKKMFNELMEFTLNNKDDLLECSNISIKTIDKKKNIEKIFFNYEKEIRNHIKTELKLKEIVKEKEIEILELNKIIKNQSLEVKNLKLKVKNLNFNTKSNKKHILDKFWNKSLNKININSWICKENTLNIKKIKNWVNPQFKSKSKLNIKNYKSFYNNI